MKDKAASKPAENKQLIFGIPGVDEILNLHKKIGSGTFSSVYLASLKSEAHISRENRRFFAVKRLIPTSSPKRIEQELKCLVNIGGVDNVGGIEACVRHQDQVAFIMPYLAHDKFHEYFDKMSVNEARLYLKNLLLALRRVHSFNMIHRDVKPSNFLYNRRDQKWMLVDFGLAQEVKEYKKEESKPSTSSQTQKRPLKEVSDENENVTTSNSGQQPPSKRICLESKPKNNEKSTKKESINVPDSIFKSPLRTSNASNLPSYYQTPLATAVKSTCIGLSVNLRMMEPHRRTATPNSVTRSTSSAGIGAATNVCYCYGKSQVCNICIVKKEVQASRAGTPGYRPPEVLLKYPHQNTAVDIWSVGIIFLSILSKCYPFFKAHDDFNALAELVTLFGDKRMKQLAASLERHMKIGQKRPALNLRKICVILSNRKPITENEILDPKPGTSSSSSSSFLMMSNNTSNLQDCQHCQQKLNNCLCASSAIIPSLHGTDMWPTEAYNLLYRMLELDPRKRITAKEALEHPFFTMECTDEAENSQKSGE
ncbi:cell division cycle 7-related protein kinase [Culicoides brevitarsis]|uniref:cell division cycle 7-related protein kinase n=1 Tax=Culicoides brevitarsis TaxID=469753 RepID=UPI00307C6388